MIKGQLVELRAVERCNISTYVEWLNDPDTMRYFGQYEPTSLVQEEEWFAGQGTRADVRNFAIYYRGEHVGGAGFANLDFRNRQSEVGLFIGHKDLWGQGLGTDTLRTLLAFGFEQLNLHRIYLRVYAEHTHAIRCYERVGFRHEGRQRDAHFRHGRYLDLLFMSILEDEYRVGQAPAAG